MIAYIRGLGLELDVFLNVWLFHGTGGETISFHAATANAAGRIWGCLLCRWFSLTIETDHCPKTLAGVTTTPAAAIKAGLQLFGFAGLLLAAWHFL
jgi:hypothetical protein